MKIRRPDLSHYAPVGANPPLPARIFLLALALSALWSVQAPWRIARGFSALIRYRERGMVTHVAAYPQYLGTAFFGFALLGLLLAGLAVWNYASCRHGARTDYLLRRLPGRGEYHRRCLALPLAGICLTAALAILLYLLYWAVYWHLFRKATVGMEDPMSILLPAARLRGRGLW